MKNNIIATAILSIPILIEVSLNRFNLFLTVFVCIICAVFWWFDESKVSSLLLTFSGMQLELKAATANAEKATKKAEITVEKFKQTIDAFLLYNLSDFQNQGNFDSTIPWKQGISFVTRAIEMNENIGTKNQDVENMIREAGRKVFDLFWMDAEYTYENIDTKIRGLIDSGFNDLNSGPRILSQKPKINFEALYNLGDDLEKEQQVDWKNDVNILQQFYKKLFP